MRNFLLFVCLFTMSLFMGCEKAPEEKFKTGFWDMNGTVLKHQLPDEPESISENILSELQDEKGLSLWFCREFFQDVCLTGKCKLIRLRLFWNGTGNYLGIEEFKNEKLTKSDHTKFDSSDYQKLDEILSDTASLLKNLKLEDLVIKSENNHLADVDAITSATKPTISSSVVKDAAFTCYTLWHDVYGNNHTKIQNILEQRANDEYLKLMFENDNPIYPLWAIQFVMAHPEFHSSFYPRIIALIRSDDVSLAQHALSYLQKAVLTDPDVQQLLIPLLSKLEIQKKYEILRKLSAIPNVENKLIGEFLRLFMNQELGVGALKLIYQIIGTENLKDKDIHNSLVTLSKSTNSYIRNLTAKLLINITINDE